MATAPRVAIVGAGIVGAALAWHLVRGGARVTVLDARAPGDGATRHSWGWINAGWGNPEPYFRLRARAMAEWHWLDREIDGLPVAWNGSLSWALSVERLRAFALQHAAWGYDIRLVGRGEIGRLEPALAAPPDLAAHASAEGAVEPAAATGILLAAARRLGSIVLVGHGVRSLERRGSRVVGVRLSDGALMETDMVVVAAGAGSPALAATMDILLPLADPPALIVTTRPCRPVLRGLVITPTMELRQVADGRLVAAATFRESDTVDGGANSARELAAEIGRLLVCEAPPELDTHVAARRPIPRDGLPIVGRAAATEGLFFAVTHSGVTLAPALGRFLADEMLTGGREPLLAPFGIERFAVHD